MGFRRQDPRSRIRQEDPLTGTVDLDRGLFRWYLGRMGSVPAALVSLGAVALHAAVSQLAPQWHVFGWTSFGVSVVAVVLNMVAAAWLRILERRAEPGWLLVHAGLVVAISSALLGGLVATRGKVVVREGDASERVVDSHGDAIAKLPFQVLLQDFQLEESVPPLTLVHSAATEIVFRKGDPVLELREGAKGRLRGIEFEVLRYLPRAELDHDTVRASSDSFAPPAAFLRYRKPGAAEESVHQGWITCGGNTIPTITQPAGAVRLAMALPPAKAYRSVVTVVERGQKPREAVIEVNRGLSLRGWTLQQLDYDKLAGRGSRVSILEAVRDPFAPWVRIGIWTTLAGIALFALREWRRPT